MTYTYIYTHRHYSSNEQNDQNEDDHDTDDDHNCGKDDSNNTGNYDFDLIAAILLAATWFYLMKPEITIIMNIKHNHADHTHDARIILIIINVTMRVITIIQIITTSEVL